MAFSALIAAALCVVPLGDDLVPATIDALLAQPDDLIPLGELSSFPAQPLVEVSLAGAVRALVDLGDVTGDGRSDLALGLGPPGTDEGLMALDGATGERLWWVAPGGSFRSPTSLDGRDARLLAGVTSGPGRVSAHAADSGALIWRREFLSHAGRSPVNVHCVRWVDDLDGDGLPDAAVATGSGLDAVLLLSGADGSTLWGHAAGDTVYALLPVHDLDQDGHLDLLALGGDATPFARLLSAASGGILWDIALDGPGTAGLALGDVDGDAVADVTVGQWNSPAPCLLALSGATGARLWEAPTIQHDVTSLAPLGDLGGTGLSDIAVGSFDNAVSGVHAATGVREWRREGPPTNGGAMLYVQALGDLDLSGLPEVAVVSQDHHAYLLGGELGHFMSKHDLGVRTTAVARVADQDGDGRPEMGLAGLGAVALLDGAAGIADGPILAIEAPAALAAEGHISLWAYPATQYALLVSLGTGSMLLPAWKKPLLLDPGTLVIAIQAVAPDAGLQGFVIEPLPVEFAGLEIHLQALQAFGPGNGWLSELASITVPTR